MAACNINGLLRQYSGPVLSGPVSSQIGSDREHIEFIEIKETKFFQTMAPRTVMEHNLLPVVPNSLPVAPKVQKSKELLDSVDDLPVSRSSALSDLSSSVQKLLDDKKPSCSNSSCTSGNQRLEARRIAYKKRLEICMKRLNSLQDKSLASLNRLLAAKLPKAITMDKNDWTKLPGSICRLLDSEETESDSEEEPSTQPVTCSDLEENWLCTRAVSCSDWHWLISEIRRSNRCIKNLRLLRSSLHKWKSGLTVHDPDFSVRASCSRATPFVSRNRKRHSYHNLASPKCARLIGELNKECNDPYVHCSCVPQHTGPCILCCGVSPVTWTHPLDRPQCVDLLHSARPLGAHIHPKLSLPGDVQLPLRLESRLATPSNFTFREHKSTLHSVSQEGKPCCLRSSQKTIKRRNRRVNGFHSLRNETKLESVPNRYHEIMCASQPPTSSTAEVGSRLNIAPLRSHAKAVNAPSALRRVSLSFLTRFYKPR
ncbi:hypothetical protein D915_002185 [Fasciola hepatica]|uniref:Uncharacterized protein n=1 Tax=Fasciola hepatica TaxID=6192 RepID=A0A4E0RVZ2_FASHE|nr:hypothetical protein D915_002185 [Fasciola hepatica]